MNRALLERCLIALEYHQSQTRPIHNTELVIEAIRTHLDQSRGEPAWHDAPNAPGLWVVGSRCLHINELDLPIYERSNCRWCGPLPEDDGGKP